MRHKQSTLPSPKKAAASAAVTPEPVTLDYPQEGETITSPVYTFRISALPSAERMEVCIGLGPWQSCRSDIGYWWYDWSDYEPGGYQLRARMHAKDGSVKMTLLRRFEVTQPA